jgi:hypothetical protein
MNGLDIVLDIVRLVPAITEGVEAIVAAIWRGDVKTVDRLTERLSTEVQIAARAAAVKAEERNKARDSFGASDVL